MRIVRRRRRSPWALDRGNLCCVAGQASNRTRASSETKRGPPRQCCRRCRTAVEQHLPCWRVYVTHYARNVFLASFSTSLFSFLSSLSLVFFLLEFVQWFGFGGGMRRSRFQLRVYKRTRYVPVWACCERRLASDFTFIFFGGCMTCFSYQYYTYFMYVHTTFFGYFMFCLGYPSIPE